MNKTVLILAGVSLVSAAAGAVGGYYYAKNKLWGEFSERLEDEVAKETLETKKFYRDLYKKEYETPEDAVRDLIPGGLTGDNKFNNTSVTNETLQRVLVGLKYMDGDPSEKEPEPRKGPEERHLAAPAQKTPEDVRAKHLEAINEQPKPVETNIFEEVRVEQHLPEDFNNERNPEKPYIISVDDFMHAEVGYPQLTFTFFEEDGMLVDEDERVIDTVEETVGLQNLQFGYLSKDPNVVYIRNEKTGYDYEVLRHQGSYAEEIGLAESQQG